MGVPINTPTLHFSRDALRAIDQDAIEKYRVPSIVLMENAAIGAAKLIHDGCKDSHSKISVVCGSGNNGGDGYATARHLDNLGHDIKILQLANSNTKDALINEIIARKMNIPIEPWMPNSISKDSVIIDAIFGTGLNRTVSGEYADAIDAINSSGCRCYALDIPSGLDCDEGTPHGYCVVASETITFVGLKLGFKHDSAKRFTGDVSVVDIGCPRSLLKKYGSSTT